MMKKRIGAMAMTLVMLSSMALAGCKKKADKPTETEKPAIPSIVEEIGAEQVTYEQRGEVKLDIEDGENGKVLHCSNRTEAWNGVNFPCNFFA